MRCHAEGRLALLLSVVTALALSAPQALTAHPHGPTDDPQGHAAAETRDPSLPPNIILPQAKPEPTAWFTNVAGESGLTGFKAYRSKWVDLNGDGWPDLIIFGNGQEFVTAFLNRNGLPDGLPQAGAARQIAKDKWTGKPEEFSWFDFNRDGVLTQEELGHAATMNLVSAFISTPRTDGKPGRTFVDVTADSGIRANHDRSGRGRFQSLLVAADLDNDGDIDLFSPAYLDWKNPQNKTPNVGDQSCVLLNDGTGAFTVYRQPVPPADAPADAVRGPNAFPSTVCAACLVDIDADGMLDVFTGSWYTAYGQNLDSFPARLYRGLGDGRLNDITQSAGLALDDSPYDVLTEAEKRSGRIAPDRVKLIGRRANRPAYGVGHADWDNDGDQDLFVMAYGRQWNCHWRNDGNQKFSEIGQTSTFDGDADQSGTYPPGVGRDTEMPFRANGNTFDCDFGDYNNDGTLDAVLGEITHWWAGPSSDRTGILTNTGAAAGWNFKRIANQLPRTHANRDWNQGDMCVAWIDVDNDGHLDLLVSSSDYPDDQRLRLFWQDPDTGAFIDLTEKAGLNWRWSTSLSLGDFDRDGDLDIMVGNTHTRLTAEQQKEMPLQAALWRNDMANRSGHHFVSLKLVGAGPAAKGANRDAIGARITLTVGGKTIIREILGGHGHMGHQDDLRSVIGVGKATKIDRLEIRWPNAGKTTSVFTNVAVDKFFRVVEGATELAADEPKAGPTVLPKAAEPW